MSFPSMGDYYSLPKRTKLEFEFMNGIVKRVRVDLNLMPMGSSYMYDITD